MLNVTSTNGSAVMTDALAGFAEPTRGGMSPLRIVNVSRTTPSLLRNVRFSSVAPTSTSVEPFTDSEKYMTGWLWAPPGPMAPVAVTT